MAGYIIDNQTQEEQDEYIEELTRRKSSNQEDLLSKACEEECDLYKMNHRENTVEHDENSENTCISVLTEPCLLTGPLWYLV